jgi:hypothetical protein
MDIDDTVFLSMPRTSHSFHRKLKRHAFCYICIYEFYAKDLKLN